MKVSTIKKYIDTITLAKENNMGLKSYCKKIGIGSSNIFNAIGELRKKDSLTEWEQKLLDCYSSKTTNSSKSTNSLDKQETDDRAEISYERDSDNKIQYYCYNIFKRDKPALTGKLTREEMNSIYRLYSYYGDSLTQRIIARHFTDLSLIDFKRILRAFNITKASSPFAPHMYEEYSEDVLREMQLREKENSFLRKAEEDSIKNTEKLLKKYAQENIDLKKQLEDHTNFSIEIPKVKPVIFKKHNIKNNNALNIYLSDMHLGSYTVSGSLYEENNNYGFDEAKRRLTVVIDKLLMFQHFETINLVLLGDNIDCCGFTGLTARRDHVMPNNMDAREQANKFLELMEWFVNSLMTNELCNKLRIFSVPEGNHAGSFEYLCNKAFLNYVNAKYPEVETVLWEKYYGKFEQNSHVFYVMHGKDAQFMKKGMPLNLDDKTKVLLYEWLMNEGAKNDDVIHFIKGDLHSNALSSCKKFDYRNVLSLYGSSDYSNYNFSQNSYGVSYDLLMGETIIRGTFENM
jgi:hypothetical protein